MEQKLNLNLLSGLIFLIVSLTLWFLIPKEIQLLESSSRLNAQTFPKIVTGTMIILSVLLIIQGLFFTKNQPTEIKEKNNTKGKIQRELNAAVMIIIFIVYALILDKVGFITSSLALCTVCLLFYKIKKWMYYAITFSAVFIVYFVFVDILRLNLP